MNQEQHYLIELTKNFVYSEKVYLSQSIDYNYLYNLSKQHNLVAIVFCVINTSKNKEVVPKETFKKFESDFFDYVYRYEIQSNIIKEIDKILSKNKIKHTFFKGSVIKELFPVPQARGMGDIDILISQDTRDTVKKIMLNNGFICKNSNGPVYDYEKDGALIEMHTKIISGKVGNSNAVEYFVNAFENCDFEDNEFSGTMNDNYQFCYLLCHIAHHFWFYGAGIKLITDLAVILNTKNIDLDYVICEMDKIGLKKFAKTLLSICKKWYNVGINYNVETIDSEYFLINFGAFGNINRNKAAIVERKQLEDGKKLSKFNTKFRLLFPSYNKLKEIPYIKFIDGKPWLIVYAWIYRLIYNLKNRRDFVKSTTSAIGDEKTNIIAQKELDLFEEIGLL